MCKQIYYFVLFALLTLNCTNSTNKFVASCKEIKCKYFKNKIYFYFKIKLRKIKIRHFLDLCRKTIPRIIKNDARIKSVRF